MSNFAQNTPVFKENDQARDVFTWENFKGLFGWDDPRDTMPHLQAQGQPSVPEKSDWRQFYSGQIPEAQPKVMHEPTFEDDQMVRQWIARRQEDPNLGLSDIPDDDFGQIINKPNHNWKKEREDIAKQQSKPKPGADISRTGTETDPTANMDDDKDLNDMEKLIKDFEGKKRKINLSPLIALTDSWTGSRLQQGYDAPMSDEEREAITMKLKGDLYQQRADRKYKKAYLTQQTAASQAKLRMEAAEKDKDRKSRESIARLNAGSREKKDITQFQIRSLSANKTGLEAIARKMIPPKDADDKSYKRLVGNINSELTQDALYISQTTGLDMQSAYIEAMKVEQAKWFKEGK